MNPFPWWDPTGEHWTQYTNWWATPSTAYVAGLIHGAQMERNRINWENDVVHRAAVHSAIATIERVDRRRAYDRGEPPP